MMQDEQMPVQRRIWQQLLKPVETLVKETLKNFRGTSNEEVEWTWFRWDIPDITAAWPKTKPNRNIHAWLTGEWPTYEVRFEGAAWRDKDLERKVIFFPVTSDLHLTGRIVAVGPAEKLRADIVDVDLPELKKSVYNLVKSVVDTKDNDLDGQPSSKLPPIPLIKK